MPPMSLYERKRRGLGNQYASGGGGLNRFLGNLATGSKTAEENVEIPQEILDTLGQEGPAYSDPGRGIVSIPYRDVRNFLPRAFGAPNTAEELNLGLSSAEREGQMKNRLGADWLKIQGTEEARNLALETFTKNTGLPPEMYDVVMQSNMRDAYIAKLGAEKEKAGEEEAKAKTGRGIEEGTRKQKQRIAANEASLGVSSSTARALASQGKPFREATMASTVAQAATPAAQLRKLLEVNLAPGETSIYNPPTGLSESLAPVLGGGFTGRGMMSERIPQMIELGGKKYPTGDMSIRNIPGGITPNTNVDEIREFLRQQQQSPSPLQAPSARSLLGRSSGGLSLDARSVLPEDMLQAQPEDNSFNEWLRKILSGIGTFNSLR